jgi:hypothetical protein
VSWDPNDWFNFFFNTGDKNMDFQALADEFVAALKDTAADIRVELKGDLIEVRDYVANRMSYLASIRGDAGFYEAVEDEAVNILLESAGAAVLRADALDERLQALAKGLLSMAARAAGLA